MDELMNTTNFLQNNLNNDKHFEANNENLTNNSNGKIYNLVEDLNNFMFESQQNHHQHQQQELNENKLDNHMKQKMNNDANLNTQLNKNSNRDDDLSEKLDKISDKLASSLPTSSINHSTSAAYSNNLNDAALQTPTSTSKSLQFDYKQPHPQVQSVFDEENANLKAKKIMSIQKNNKYSKMDTTSNLLDDFSVSNDDDNKTNIESSFKTCNNSNIDHHNGNHQHSHHLQNVNVSYPVDLIDKINSSNFGEVMCKASSSHPFNTFETNPLIASKLTDNFLNELNLPNNRTLNSTNGFRREGSLDRADFDMHSKRAIFNPFLHSYGQQQQQQQQIPNYPIYANSTLYLNVTPTTTQPNTQSFRRTNHRRSNSILSANSFQTNSNTNTLGRDYILNPNGLRSTLRASSVTNIQRDQSCNSVKSLNANNGSSNLQQHQQQQSSADSNQSRLNFIRDLQIRFMDVQKECYYLKCELNTCQQKLSASIQSIKQFWSPELKKERQLRKDESCKYYELIEQYKLIQQQYQSLMETYEQQAHTVQDLQSQLQFSHNSHDDLQGNKNFQREKTILKKIINELEMRINTQKQTLNAKDETIKKLFQLIKSLNTKGSGSDLTMIKNDLVELDQLTNKYESIQQLKERLQEEERKNLQLQEFIQHQQENKSVNSIYNTLNSQKSNRDDINLLTHLDLKLSTVDDTNPFVRSNPESSLLIEAKEIRMKQLENQVKKLQHELIATKANIQQQNFNYSSNENIHMINENSTSSNHVSPNVLNCNQAISSSNASALANQIELFKTNEKFYKEKIESLKSELNAKETECEHLKTKFETCESKEKDLQHYLLLLKESITTKDQQMSMQQTEMNEMRTKIKDKEATIEKKNQHLQAIQLEKHQNESDLNEIRDQMDIKERKINVLNRKIENLEEQLKDKEMQINTLRSKLNMNNSSIYHTSIIQNLEQSLDQKEKLIEKLSKDININNKTQERESELNEHVEKLNLAIKELNEKVEIKNKEVQDYQNELFDLKDELENLRTQLIRKDSHVTSLEMSLTRKNEEIELIEEKLQHLQTNQQQQDARSNHNLAEMESIKKQYSAMQKELEQKEAQIQQLTVELITLKELIDDFEEQKQVLKSKLELQINQFGQLEKQFTNTINEYELRMKLQHNEYEEQINLIKANQVECEKLFQQQQQKREEKSHQQIDMNEQQQIDFQKVEKRYQEELSELKNILNEKEILIKTLQIRIEEIEEALRESVSITAEREYVMSQQKKKLEKLEVENKSLQEDLSIIKKSFEDQQQYLCRYKQDLVQREDHLQKLEEEKVKQMDELLITKQELLLSTISEKDAIIGSLEVEKGDKKINRLRIQQLMDDKDNLHKQLKELNEKRMKLMQEFLKEKEAKDKIKAIVSNKNMGFDEDGIYL